MPITIPTQAYCNTNEVLALLPGRVYDSNSRPTLQQAEEICIAIAKEINAKLRALGLTVPLTNQDDIDTIKPVNLYGAAWRCELATMLGTNGFSQTADEYRKKYESELLSIKKGEYKFSGAGSPPSSEADASDTFDDGEPRTINFKYSDRNQF